jgi:hypothetical protein
MMNLVVAFRSFAEGSDKESKCWTDLSIRRDQRSCKPHFVSPRAKICHMFVTGDFRSDCQSFGGRSFEGRAQGTRYPAD